MIGQISWPLGFDGVQRKSAYCAQVLPSTQLLLRTEIKNVTCFKNGTKHFYSLRLKCFNRNLNFNLPEEDATKMK